jgi:ABC-type ATPase with predicted acetyltransferase domain
MEKTEFDHIMTVLQRAGDSNQESRKAVLDFHGGAENMKLAANLWAEHHHVMLADEGDALVAYATAVDLGFRIAQVTLVHQGDQG